MVKPEKPRFIRTLYKLWGLLLLDNGAKKEKIKTLVFKDAVAMYELSQADRDLIQDKQVLQMAENPNMLENITGMLYPLLNYFVVHILGDEEGYDRRHAPLDWRWHGRVFFWESYFGDHKEMITKRDFGDEDPIANISAVWYDTDDEMDQGTAVKLVVHI